MFKVLFDFFINFLSLPINPIYEYLIISLIGLVAFIVAWLISPGGELGSFIHYIIRFGVFLALWILGYVSIKILFWIQENQKLLMIMFVPLVVLILAAYIIFLLFQKKKHKNK